MTIPHNLISATRSGEVVPLIGSGISQASGMASWDNLIEALKSIIQKSTGELVSPDIDVFDTPDIFGRHQDLISILTESFGDGFKPNKLHDLLSSIPFKTLLTTNWDILIEESLRTVSKKVNAIYNEETARTWREPEAIQIIKFHGSIHVPSSVVAGLKNYSSRYHNQSVLMDLVRTVIATRPILSIGFGMKDPFVKSLLQAVSSKTGPEHYIVIPDFESKSRKSVLENMNLIVIEAPTSKDDPFGVESFLGDLWKNTYTEAKNRIDRTGLLIRETDRLETYLGADKNIRVRASMGPLAVPDNNELDVFGGEDVYATEVKLLESVKNAIKKKNGKIKLICCPLDGGQHSSRKGYSLEGHKARLKAFMKWVNELGSNVELVTTSRPSDINDWIVSTFSLVESRKHTKEGRLYQYARLEVNSNIVSSTVKRFDEEFEMIASQNGGIDECKKQFLELAQKEIDA